MERLSALRKIANEKVFVVCLLCVWRIIRKISILFFQNCEKFYSIFVCYPHSRPLEVYKYIFGS